MNKQTRELAIQHRLHEIEEKVWLTDNAEAILFLREEEKALKEELASLRLDMYMNRLNYA